MGQVNYTFYWRKKAIKLKKQSSWMLNVVEIDNNVSEKVVSVSL